jgi:hypothetical protein
MTSALGIIGDLVPGVPLAMSAKELPPLIGPSWRRTGPRHGPIPCHPPVEHAGENPRERPHGPGRAIRHCRFPTPCRTARPPAFPGIGKRRIAPPDHRLIGASTGRSRQKTESTGSPAGTRTLDVAPSPATGAAGACGLPAGILQDPTGHTVAAQTGRSTSIPE